MKNLLTLLAALVAAGSVQAQGAKGDAKAGEGKIAMCIGCHGIPGYQASFPAGLQGADDLGAERAIHQCRAQRLSQGRTQAPDDARHCRVAHRPGHRRRRRVLRAARQVRRGAARAAGAAVGAGGGSCCKRVRARPAMAPTSTSRSTALIRRSPASIADYLFFALKAYQTEQNPNVGRANAIMAAQVKQFSAADLKAIAEYIALAARRAEDGAPVALQVGHPRQVYPDPIRASRFLHWLSFNQTRVSTMKRSLARGLFAASLLIVSAAAGADPALGQPGRPADDGPALAERVLTNMINGQVYEQPGGARQAARHRAGAGHRMAAAVAAAVALQAAAERQVPRRLAVHRRRRGVLDPARAAADLADRQLRHRASARRRRSTT